MNKPVVVIQARMGSTRLPGKVLKPIVGKPMLWHIVQRARWIEGVTNVVVATSEQQQDQPIRDFCLKHEIAFTAGSESDVLERFYQAAVQCGGDPLIRITADCPFIDPEVVTRLLQLYNTGQYDHVGVATGASAIFMKDRRFPDGLDAECFSFNALEQAWYEAQEPDEREHVTPLPVAATRTVSAGTSHEFQGLLSSSLDG